MLCDVNEDKPWADFKDHIIASHSIRDEEKLQIIKNAGRRPAPHLEALECPFCEDWVPNMSGTDSDSIGTTSTAGWRSAKQFQRHVASHQEQLAAFDLLGYPGETVNDGEVLSRSTSSPLSKGRRPSAHEKGRRAFWICVSTNLHL